MHVVFLIMSTQFLEKPFSGFSQQFKYYNSAKFHFNAFRIYRDTVQNLHECFLLKQNNKLTMLELVKSADRIKIIRLVARLPIPAN